jgi:hypothetical protein
VSIQWGDGSSATLPVVASGGAFSVTAIHLYGSAGSYLVTLTIVDAGGATASGQRWTKLT